MITKALFIVLALGLCSSASATLITYEYDFSAHKIVGTNPPQTFAGDGRLTVDTAKLSMADLYLKTDEFIYDWSGVAYFSVDAVKAIDNRLLGNLSITADRVFLFFDLFYWPAEENPLEYLESVEEQFNVLTLPDGNVYHLYGRYTRVLEPSTLALLSLALFGFVAKRKLFKIS